MYYPYHAVKCQTVQAQKQSDQSQYCLPAHLYLLDALLAFSKLKVDPEVMSLWKLHTYSS